MKQQQSKRTVWLIGAAVLSSVIALGAVPQGSKAPPTGATKAAQKAPTPKTRAALTRTISGTVAAYDASANTVTVKTATGNEVVSVDAKTRISEGSKTLNAADLSGLIGRNVKVRSQESGGKLTATSIAVGSAGR